METMLENNEYRKANACHWLLILRNQASHMTGVFLFYDQGIGDLPNKQKSVRKGLGEACPDPIAFCDSTGHRLPLGWTRKWNPTTLLYQGFLERKIQEKEAVDNVVEWITFSV